ALHRRVARDGVQHDCERISEHSELVGHAVGHLVKHAVVSGHQLRVAPTGVARGPGMDAGRDGPDAEARAQAVVAPLAGRTERAYTAGSTRQPRVEDDAVTDLQTLRLRAQRDDVGHHLVT